MTMDSRIPNNPADIFSGSIVNLLQVIWRRYYYGAYMPFCVSICGSDGGS